MLGTQSLADRRSELCGTLFKQIVNKKFHSIHYLLPAKHDTQLISQLRSTSLSNISCVDKTIYHVPCKNCSSSYVGETGRKFGLRIKEHKKEVDSFTAGTQTQASRARESSVTHKSAITDPAVEENHVID